MSPEEKIVSAYDVLVERALKAAAEPPYYVFIDNDGYARLAINGDEAELKWITADTSHDCVSIDYHSITLPLSLLQMPEAEFVAWQHAERKKYIAAQRAADAARADLPALVAAQQEAQERRLLAQLQAKYHPATLK